MAQNLSVPLAFVALLHLANEKVSFFVGLCLLGRKETVQSLCKPIFRSCSNCDCDVSNENSMHLMYSAAHSLNKFEMYNPLCRHNMKYLKLRKRMALERETCTTLPCFIHPGVLLRLTDIGVIQMVLFRLAAIYWRGKKC